MHEVRDAFTIWDRVRYHLQPPYSWSEIGLVAISGVMLLLLWLLIRILGK